MAASTTKGGGGTKVGILGKSQDLQDAHDSEKS